MSKYKIAPATDDDDDDPFLITAQSSATGVDRHANSDSGSDVEMPGIGEIIAEKEARESQRVQKERLQQLKLAVLAQQQQRRASTSAGVPRGAELDSDDDDNDELDVVQDTMHSVAREEAAARAVAGRTRPSVGRTTQLRLARVAASPQRNATAPASLLPAAASESPEKRMAAAAQPTFLSSLAGGSGGAAAGRGKRGVAGMTKDELERMVLRSAEAQSERLRKEKEEEWVRRGGRVVGVMEDLGEEKVQELIGEALERSEGTHAQGDGDDAAGSDEDDDDDGDYVPIERGSASPQHIKSQEAGHDEESKMATDERPDNDDGIAEAAAATEVDSETEMDSSIPDNVRMHRLRAGRPRRAIIGSDDEDGPSATPEETQHLPPPLSLPDLPSPAFTATASPWLFGNAEPDHDQENDPDVSGNDTDKENRAVVVVGPSPTRGARVLFNDILSARAAGMKATVQPLPLLQSSVLPADDDPFAFTPSPAKALRRLASPVPRQLADKRGLSQMFEEEEENDSVPVPALVIQGGRDDDGALPGSADPGLVGFKPVLGGLSQAFGETQVRRTPPPLLCLYNRALALTRHVCRTHQDLDWD